MPSPVAVAIELSDDERARLQAKLLGRGAHRSVRALNADIRAWIDA